MIPAMSTSPQRTYSLTRKRPALGPGGSCETVTASKSVISLPAVASLLLLLGAQRQPGGDEQDEQDEPSAIEKRLTVAPRGGDAAGRGHFGARRGRQTV